ncbi:MAG TPA: F0F1 ATP synthase subunit B [Anaerolineae bacterium]|nr:F0F1 ATP synthase subunit B [Anaerolineae bacterium]
MEALGINLGYIVSQIVNFTLLALLLYFVAYKPVLGMLDQRRERIRQGLEDAEAASRRAAEVEQEYERRMAEARRDGQEVVARATQMSEQTRQELLEEARADAQQLIARAREEIAREREQAMAELRQQVADLSLTIADKVLGEALDRNTQRRLIAAFIDETEEFK